MLKNVENGLELWRRQLSQWQCTVSDIGPVNSYRMSPHMQRPLVTSDCSEPIASLLCADAGSGILRVAGWSLKITKRTSNGPPDRSGGPRFHPAIRSAGAGSARGPLAGLDGDRRQAAVKMTNLPRNPAQDIVLQRGHLQAVGSGFARHDEAMRRRRHESESLVVIDVADQQHQIVAKLRGEIERLEHQRAADAFAGTVLRDRKRTQQQGGVAGLADQDRPVADGAHQSVAFQRDPAQLLDWVDALSEQV